MIHAIIGDLFSQSKAMGYSEGKNYFWCGESEKPGDISLLLLAVGEGLIAGIDNPEETRRCIQRAIRKIKACFPRFQPERLDAAACGVVVGRLYIQLGTIESYAQIVADALHPYVKTVSGIEPVAVVIGFLTMGIRKEKIGTYMNRKYKMVESDSFIAGYRAFFSGDSYDEVFGIAIEELEESRPWDRACTMAVAAGMAGGAFAGSKDAKEQAVKCLEGELGTMYETYWKFLIEKRFKIHDHNDCRLCPAYKQCRGNHPYKER